MADYKNSLGIILSQAILTVCKHGQMLRYDYY